MSLHADDLRHFVKKTFEVDSFKSKIGDDEDVVTLSFTVDHEDPAKDLENFIEMGYSFVLDADTSPGETDDGTYKVFVELERGRHVAEQIREMLEGIEKLTGIDKFRFRYFKSFRSQAATEENLSATIPTDGDAYKIATERHKLDNFSGFFSTSYADNVDVVNESISFKRIWKDPVSFDIITSGTRQQVYESVKGPVMLEGSSMAEVMFLTKFIGNYNITKIGDTFIFENSGWAVALKRK
jgi:hypothetical protein